MFLDHPIMSLSAPRPEFQTYEFPVFGRRAFVPKQLPEALLPQLLQLLHLWRNNDRAGLPVGSENARSLCAAVWQRRAQHLSYAWILILACGAICEAESHRRACH